MRAVGKSNESLFHLTRRHLRGRAATLPVAISVVISELWLRVSTHARGRRLGARDPRDRLGLTPARGDATGSQAADATKRGAPGAPRRVVSEEDLEAAELMCSLRDVIEPPATRVVRRRHPAGASNPSKLPAPRRTLPAPERRGVVPKSACKQRGAKKKRGSGRVESLLTRARGVARQLAPPFPALKRCGSITEALAYIDAQPPPGAPVDGRERRLQKTRREPTREETPRDEKSPFPTPVAPFPSRDRVPAAGAVSAGNPHGRPTPKPLGTVRAFLARGGALLASLDAKWTGATAAIPSSENADKDGEENADGENGDEKVSTPKRRKLPTRSLAEPGCARARPFVREGDVGDEDVALYLPDERRVDDEDADDDDDLLLATRRADASATRARNHRRRERLPSTRGGGRRPNAPSPPRATSSTTRPTTPRRSTKRLMLPCVVARVSGTGCLSRRAADAANALDSASKPSRNLASCQGLERRRVDDRATQASKRRAAALGVKRTNDEHGPPR